MPGHGQGILGVALQAQVQRLDPLQQQEGAEGRQGRAGVAQPLHARLEDEGQGAEGLGVGKAVVGGVRFGEVLEAP